MRRAVISLVSLFFMATISPGASAWGGSQPVTRGQLESLVIRELEKINPGARIRLNGPIRMSREVPSEVRGTIEGAQFLGDDGRGEAAFRVQVAQTDESGELTRGYLDVRAPFSALVRAPIAVRRIQPREKLKRDFFVEREVDVARGMERQYRGLILPMATNFGELEARQTILEGQFPILTGVQKIPDVRRGDAVQLRLLSGGLVLSTDGVVEEAAYAGDSVRVISRQTKKQLQGKLKDKSTVEVSL